MHENKFKQKKKTSLKDEQKNRKKTCTRLPSPTRAISLPHISDDARAFMCHVWCAVEKNSKNSSTVIFCAYSLDFRREWVLLWMHFVYAQWSLVWRSDFFIWCFLEFSKNIIRLKYTCVYFIPYVKYFFNR